MHKFPQPVDEDPSVQIFNFNVKAICVAQLPSTPFGFLMRLDTREKVLPLKFHLDLIHSGPDPPLILLSVFFPFFAISFDKFPPVARYQRSPASQWYVGRYQCRSKTAFWMRGKTVVKSNESRWNAVMASDRNTNGEVTQMNRTSFSVELTRTGKTMYEV